MRDAERIQGLLKAVGMALLGAVLGTLFLSTPIATGDWGVLLPSIPLAFAGTAVFAGLVWEILVSREEEPDAGHHAEEHGPPTTPGLKAA